MFQNNENQEGQVCGGEDEILDFVGKIYDASYRPEQWEEVLKTVAELTGARSCVMLYTDKRHPRSNLFMQHGFDKEVINLYFSRYAALDPFPRLFMEHAGVGKVFSDHFVSSDRDVLEKICGEYYTDYMVPHDIFHIGGVTLFGDADRFLALAIQRGKAAGPYSDEELAQLDLLAPHFERAFRIRNEFTRLQHRARALRSVLDQMVVGLIMLDTTGSLVYINPLAQEIAQYHPALNLSKNHVRAANASEDAKFQQLITACQEANGNAKAGGVLGLHHYNVDLPLSVLVVPVCQTEVFTTPSERRETVAIFVSDPSKAHAISPEALEIAYALTKRESEVAIAVANGQSVSEIAQSGGTTENTVRSQLKAVFRKTNTGRQTELVKLLLTGPFNIQ